MAVLCCVDKCEVNSMVKKKRQTTDALDNDLSTDSSEEKTMSSFCKHIKNSVDTLKLRKALKSKGVQHECMQCNSNAKKATAATEAETEAEAENVIPEDYQSDNTLWMCLRCGTQLCGRANNQHALQHFKTPHSDSHALAMNTHSYLVWCYECNEEVKLEARKNLHECVEMIKKLTLKPPTPPTAHPPPALKMQNLEDKILSTWATIQPLVSNDPEVLDTKLVLALPAPPPPPAPALQPACIPGKAKRVVRKTGCYNRTTEMEANGALPRVRGLTNLGNTCFFNAVLQCLAQTPYLLDVLKESSEPGEE